MYYPKVSCEFFSAGRGPFHFLFQVLFDLCNCFDCQKLIE